MSGTANAAETWGENKTISSTQQITGGVNVTADITLTIPTGVTLTVNGVINANGKTLTVSGDGTLIVRGTNGTDGTDSTIATGGGYGFTGNMIVNGTTVVQVTGGNGGNSSNSTGGKGGYGISGNITVNSGSVEVTGGKGGDGSNGNNGGSGGNGIYGNITVSSGSVKVTGGDGGNGYSVNGGNGGNGGKGISGNITVNSGSVNATGGKGGNSGNGKGGDGGNGIQGNITVNSGSVKVTGGYRGNGGTGSNGSNGQAVAGTITASKAQESDDGSTWTPLSGPGKRYVKIEITPVTGVSLDKTAITNLPLGDTVTLTATVSPDNATSKAVTWTTSDENIVSVDQSGDVTAMGVGTATITATATNGTTAASDDKTATCTVTVIKNPTITFDANGGSGSMNVQTISYDVATTLTANAFTRTGYTFNGWNTKADGTGTSYADGASIKLTADTTLYAQWTANTYTVKFNGNGGTGSMSDQVFTYDTEGTLSDNKFTRAGYTFNGWKDNDGNKTYNDGASVKNLTATNGAAITLYAQWKVNQYTLTFNTNGGSAISAITQDYGTAVTAPANPTKEGYTFNGWDKEIPSTMPAENLTFTAQWKENEKTPDTDPESDDKQATEESADKTPESKTANAEAVSTMSNEELKQTFENKTAITLTGNISNENLSSVIEKIANVTEVKTLDLSKLGGVTEVKLKETTAVETLSVAGNQTITKVEVQNNTSLKSINLSSSKVETIDAKGCTELTEVILTSCDELQKLDVSETLITKLDTSNCEKLSSINCNSCDISELNIDGCKKLADLNCANNSLTRLDVSGFALNSLECEHQTVKGFIKRASFNILDILLRRLEAFVTSDANDDSGYVANVKDIKGVDENGNEFSPASYKEETGEVVFSKAPANIKYNYITGFSDISMDVTVETSGESQQINSLGSSGGGCDMGFAGLGVLALALTFMKKNHSK